MLVSSILPIAFAATTYAAAIVPRDVATIQGAFDGINTAVVAFDAAVLAFSGSSGTANLGAKSQSVITQLSSGTAAVTATSSVSLTDAISLINSAATLRDNFDKTVTDLISKKSVLDAVPGASALVLAQLQLLKTGTQAFIAAVVSKVPQSVRDIATTQAQAVIISLNRGITAFGGST
jgi:hypothetical protein